VLPQIVQPEIAPDSPPRADIFLIAFRLAAEPKTPAQRQQKSAALGNHARHVLLPRLRKVPQVADVTVVGGLRWQFVADPEKVAAHKLSPNDVYQAVDRALGALAGKANLASPDDVGNIVVAEGKGKRVLFKDVAELRLEDPDAWAGARRWDNSRPAVLLAIRRRRGADPGKLAVALDRALRELRRDLPPGVKLDRKVPKKLAPLADWTAERLSRELPPRLKLTPRLAGPRGPVLRPQPRGRLYVKVFAEELPALWQAVRDVRAAAGKVPGVGGVQVWPPVEEVPQWIVMVQREQAQKHGIQVADVYAALYTATEPEVGVEMGNKRPDIKALEKVRVPGAGGAKVPLSRLVKAERVSGPAALYREDGKRAALVFLGVQGGRDPDAVLDDLRRALAPLEAALHRLSKKYYVVSGPVEAP
jgi:Cu/Ag efflux pump CusA